MFIQNRCLILFCWVPLEPFFMIDIPFDTFWFSHRGTTKWQVTCCHYIFHPWVLLELLMNSSNPRESSLLYYYFFQIQFTNNTLWSSLNAWKGPQWENFPNLFHREQRYREFKFLPVTLSSLRVHFIPFLYADSLTMFFLPYVWEEGYWTALPNHIFSTTPVSVYDPLTFQHFGMFSCFRMTLLFESLSLLISHDCFSLLSGTSNKWCTQALCFLVGIL